MSFSGLCQGLFIMSFTAYSIIHTAGKKKSGNKFGGRDTAGDECWEVIRVGKGEPKVYIN